MSQGSFRDVEHLGPSVSVGRGNLGSGRVKPPVSAKDELLNVRLAKKEGFTGLKLKPRDYQVELYHAAVRGNVIIYLGTGLGKTFIVVMYINSPLVGEKLQQGKKLVFLAPTQDLVKQQAEYINKQVPFRVKIFCGRTAHCGLHIDHWDKAAWDSELKNVDILCMTPMIFAAAIGTGHLVLTDFVAIIFDEVHHARQAKKSKAGHPYFGILSHYQFFFKERRDELCWPRPRLIGLTASLINSMPKNRDSIREDIHRLEQLISGRCLTNIEVQDKKPTHIIHTYTSFTLVEYTDILLQISNHFVGSINEALKTDKIHRLSLQRDYIIRNEDAKLLAFENRLRLSASGFSIKPSSFPKVMQGLVKIRTRGGLWMMRAVTYKLILALKKHEKHPALNKEIIPVYVIFIDILEKIYLTLDNQLNRDPERGLLSYTRPKPKALLEKLKYEYESTMTGSNGKTEFSCIIFVTSRLEVVALNAWLQTVSTTLPEYSFIKCDYAIGLAAAQSSKYSCITQRKATEQHKMLNDFRQGVFNTIITTSVLEEGIDLPICSTVFRYDSPGNFRQYVQSRGRARQDVASFVVLCEENDFLKEVEKLDKFSDFEKTLRETLGDKDIANIVREPRQVRDTSTKDEIDHYSPENSNMRIVPNIAQTILLMYCSRLAQRTPFSEGVRYDRIEFADGCFQTTLFLPTGCPIKEGVKGGVKSDQDLADKSAMVAAVRVLHIANELNDHGAPTRVTEANIDALLETKGLNPKMSKEIVNPDEEIIKEEDKEIFLYKPAIRSSNDCLSRNSAERAYKLIKFKFVSKDPNNREETEKFFTEPVFGLIVDASVNSEFIPPLIFTHYGQFEVMNAVVTDNFLITTYRDHEEFLNYTHRLLSGCLGMWGISKNDFCSRCIFYLVPLRQDNLPDVEKMRRSFRILNLRLKENDIVKTNSYYRNLLSGNRNLLLVKKIHDDMNVNSIIPRTRKTFAEYYAEKAGPNAISRSQQPIVEVMPISSEFASENRGRRSNRDHQTNTLYFPQEFLDLFAEDASCVFQSFLFPYIIHRLYITNAASSLDKKFIEETTKDRNEIILTRSHSKPLKFNNVDGDDVDDNDETMVDDPVDSMSLDSQDDDYEGKDSSDEDYDSSNENGNSHSELDEENDIIHPEYADMLQKRFMNLESENNTDDMKPWKMSEYRVTDLEKQPYKLSHSTGQQELSVMTDDFIRLKNMVSPLIQDLVDRIDMFAKRITSDNALLDEDGKISKRTAKVDLTIEPPFKLDHCSEPIRQGSRERGLIEALTQRRAGETYNLEGLENIGDSYLKYIASVVLFRKLDGNEGFLTAARSRLTSNKHFNYLARKKNLGSHAITKPFSKDMLAFILGKTLSHEDAKVFYNKMRPKSLADTFESIVGSYLVYQSEYEAILVLKWLGLDIVDFSETFDEFHKDAVVFSKAPTAMIDGDSPAAMSYIKSCSSKLRKFEEILGYPFNDMSYLVQAFTHCSAPERCTRSYERLEFLGDAILDYLVTATLAKRTRMNDPGQLSGSRSALVNNVAFARLAMKYRFDLFIQHGSFDLYDELSKVREALDADLDMKFLDMTNFDRIVKLLGDSFESVAGAIYLDSGNSLDTVWKVYYPMMKEAIDDEIREPTKNMTAALYETFPGKDRITFLSEEIEKTESGATVKITCRILIYDEQTEFQEFEGEGLSHKQAKQRAIRLAMAEAPEGQVKVRLDKKFRGQFGRKNDQSRPAQRGGHGHGSREHRSHGGGRSRRNRGR